MQVSTGHRGRQLPFERERRLVLRRLPAGAAVRHAALSVAPYSVDPGRRFLETIAFPTPAGDWGASKSLSSGAVEIDLHARRKLAAMSGSNLDAGVLLVDLGGGFLSVNADGGLGGTTTFAVHDTVDLPGLTVTGLRLGHANADIASLKVASPPSNLTVAIEGGPVFFTHFGDLVAPVRTPDFSAVLNAMLPDLPVEDGAFVVPFVVHSDTIARLDLALELDFTISVDAMPSGLSRVNAPYAFDGAPVSTNSAGSRLSLVVPSGMVAVPGATRGRAQGAFESSRVVYGPVTAIAVEHIALTADGPLAHPFEVPATVVASSIDVLLTAVTAQAELTVDLVDDLDGKPGRASALSRPAPLTLSRDRAGSPTWLNVPLPEELQLPGGVRHWLTLQARDGSAAWGAAVADGDGPVLQRTSDGGLSWRAVPGDRGGLLRLRQTTSAFNLPLELRIGSGDAEVPVSLQRFAAQGAVDIDLTFDDVAHAVNTAVAAATTTPPTAEHIANGDFADWYRVGTKLNDAGPLEVPGQQYRFGPATAFAPGGATVYAGAHAGGEMRLVAFDALSELVDYDMHIGAGVPVAMAVDPVGRRAVVVGDDVGGGELAHGGLGVALVLVDLADGRPVGVPLATVERPVEVAAAPDGTGVYVLGAGDGSATVRFVPWSILEAAAGGADLDWDAQPSDRISDEPLALTVGADGRIYVLTGAAASCFVHAYEDRSAIGAGSATTAPALADARDLGVTPSGDQLLVLAPTDVMLLWAADLRPLGTVALGQGADAQCLAVDPAGEVALIIQNGPVLELDLHRRVLLPDTGVDVGAIADGARITISPTGTHAAVARTTAQDLALIRIGAAQPSDWELTGGEVRPHCVPGSGEVMALLGRLANSRKTDVLFAAMSQVVPAAGNARYRFGFDSIAESEGAVGQLIWRGDDCAVGRTDKVDVEVFNADEQETLDRIPRHEVFVTSPPGAVQVEVRFATAEGAMLIDRVELAGSSLLNGDTWQPHAPTTSVTAAGGGVTVTNGGAVDAVVTQPVALTGGQHFDLLFSVRVSAAGGAIELAFADQAGMAVGTPARFDLDPLQFDERALSGDVPAGAVDGELRIVVPVGGSVELNALSLTSDNPADVGLQFVSEAPGELTVSGVSVQLDQGTPQPAPIPAEGLCPPAPAGDTDTSYCCSCGEQRPVRRPTPVVMASGRPAAMSRCPVCGADRLRSGGRLVRHADPVRLPRFRALDRPENDGPALVVRTRVDALLTDVDGISVKRAAQLETIGIRDVIALADADVHAIADIAGISEPMAVRFIADAGHLVRTRGERFVPTFAMR